MSIASEISRLQTAKSDIKTAIETKGVTVPSSATIDTYDDYVSQISGGGGSPTPSAFTSWEYSDWGKITNVVISSTQTSIPDSAFQYCASLSSVTIPTSVTSIGTHAFDGCTNLSSITISSSVTSIAQYAFSTIGNPRVFALDVSNINLSSIVPSSNFAYVFSSSNLKGNITIPNSLLNGATSGASTTCYYLFNSCYASQGGLNIDAYCNDVIIPRGMFGFANNSNILNSNGLNLTIHGTPTFLSRMSISCSSGGSVTFADCRTPPDAESYASATTSPFYYFKGTLYVPSGSVSAWQTKYTGIASQIKSIPI